MIYTHTKIICTIGPATRSLEKILALGKAGMNVARINCSHGTHQEHLEIINNVKEARKILKSPLAIMLDTKGPEIRLGILKNNQLEVKPKQKLKLVANDAKADDEVPINPFKVLDVVKPSQKILFDDGYIISKVLEKKDDHILVEVQNSGILKNQKSVNIPNVKLPLEAVTKQDIEDLKFGCSYDIDIVAASFIRSADHVFQIKKILEKENKKDVLVIAKIESSEGVDNFEQIADAADGIMVARGDLGVEVDLSLVPKLQKIMVSKCYTACKPVVIATQMLESMISNPRPTRAEVSDVANAIYDSASAVMLSAETAAGKYPVETVEQMKKIIHEAEQDFDYKSFFYKQAHVEYEDIATAVSISTVKTAYSCRAAAIFAVTKTGFTARLLTRLRPQMPIVVLTRNEKKYNQLAFNWGVMPVYAPDWKTEREAVSIMSDFATNSNVLSFGDLVVLISSFPFDKRAFTNLMVVESIGNILVRGQKGIGGKIKAQIYKFMLIDKETALKAKDKIIVIKQCEDSYEEIIKNSKGVILQNNEVDVTSENKVLSFAEKYKIPVIIRAKSAFEILNDDEIVYLDPVKALIYNPTEDNA